MEQEFLIGTYTQNGIYKLSFNNGTFYNKLSDNTFENCSYLCKNNTTIYNIIEYSDILKYSNGYVISRNADLSVLNSCPLSGHGPCFIRIDNIRKLLFIANYGDGSIDIFSLNTNGSLNKLIYHKKHSDNSRIHYLAFSDNNNILYAVDLGNDSLLAYQIEFDGSNIELSLFSSYHFPKNSHPRHLTVIKDSIFVVTELSCKLYKLSFDNKNGLLFDNCVPLLPNNIMKKSDYTGCAIKISNDFKFIYTTIRGHNSISVFTQSLDLIQNISCFGITPRDINFDIGQDYLFCANQNSNNISIFERNKKTGYLNYKSSYPISSPACII